MNAKRIMLVVVLAVASMAALAVAEEKPKTHTLPKDAATPVIVYDATGGMILRVNNEPLLEVLADGTVKAGDPWGQGRKVEGKISAEELQGLLRFILDQQKFSEITAKDLQLPAGMMVTDASTTTLTVDADGNQQHLSGRAVETVARRAGPNSPAARFETIVRRLDNLINVTKLGGAAATQKLLDAANAALKADHPKDGQVAAEDILRVSVPKDGGCEAVFVHKVTAPGGKWHMVQVTVNQPADGKAKVTVATGAEQDPH